MNSFIPLSVPNLKGNELKYVTDAIESEWVSTAGRYVAEFEEKIAEYVNAKGAVSCQNGTSGLHISLLLAGITMDDAVFVPTLTFIAAVNPVKYIGASPIFMDCDDSLCMDPIKLEQYCREECVIEAGKLIDKVTHKHIKAIVIVHVFGNMADMVAIMEIATKYHLKVVEDATEAIGSYYISGRYVGKYAGTIGDFGVYSFNGNKIMTTGGGGMIISNDENCLKKAKHLTTQAKSDEVNFLHDEIGYNYRMTNIQAAIGLAQLEQLEGFIQTKEDNYLMYKSLFKNSRYKLLDVRNDIRSNRWFYALFCDDIKTRDGIIKYLSKKQIQTRPIWGLIHQQIPYVSEKAYRIEKAILYWERIVNIPCSTNLGIEEVERIVEQILNY
ncbi:MAG: LegC family aminotransferase [Lachnospiraceae bacterium]|nr:LegC family aminotransferase [Lachnospiraceae bacterium]